MGIVEQILESFERVCGDGQCSLLRVVYLRDEWSGAVFYVSRDGVDIKRGVIEGSLADVNGSLGFREKGKDKVVVVKGDIADVARDFAEDFDRCAGTIRDIIDLMTGFAEVISIIIDEAKKAGIGKYLISSSSIGLSFELDNARIIINFHLSGDVTVEIEFSGWFASFGYSYRDRKVIDLFVGDKKFLFACDVGLTYYFKADVAEVKFSAGCGSLNRLMDAVRRLDNIVDWLEKKIGLAVLFP